ncbi:hypothetical protein BBBOND_0205850 [Babesia bigemina]|uniref:Uncharacterized protein n=1 Tax=Babesia bigemina TaxID=5866 RepID=A0A061D5Y3_BABBI|nr:hypothetical protein BBBOND_0205850 [Babesia bigemina]CDR95427.1 hypothetical protein BBBOND_0205850 [Babesia bigemina]|eukprot:XP_012767613.1 hypothetical protein BBBOND_0205850 [Babesia bigemina]
MVYTSLTEVPHNLKEGIDWLVALKGTYGENNLKTIVGAIQKFLSYHRLHKPQEAKKHLSYENINLSP